jgi:hypothetical protein
MLISSYVVLWAKAKDLEEIKQEAVPKLLHESLEYKSSKFDLKEFYSLKCLCN